MLDGFHSSSCKLSSYLITDLTEKSNCCQHGIHTDLNTESETESCYYLNYANVKVSVQFIEKAQEGTNKILNLVIPWILSPRQRAVMVCFLFCVATAAYSWIAYMLLQREFMEIVCLREF